MRWVNVRVLPVPGPATISSGPPGADAATRCIASSRSSRPVPTSSMPASIGSNGSCGEGGGAIGGGGGGAAFRFGSALGAAPPDLVQRGTGEDLQLGAERGDQLVEFPLDLLAPRPHLVDLAEDLGQ